MTTKGIPQQECFKTLRLQLVHFLDDHHGSLFEPVATYMKMRAVISLRLAS